MWAAKIPGNVIVLVHILQCECVCVCVQEFVTFNVSISNRVNGSSFHLFPCKAVESEVRGERGKILLFVAWLKSINGKCKTFLECVGNPAEHKKCPAISMAITTIVASGPHGHGWHSLIVGISIFYIFEISVLYLKIKYLS